MSDVRVTIGANSAPLESEFDKVKQSAGKLRKSVGDVGGVLEGDRRVENKMTAFVEGFKSAQNGADLLANTMGNLGDVFKSSLAVGVALNVGASLVGMFSSAITECDNLKKSAEATGTAIKDALASKDSGQISAMLKTANEEMAKLQERMKSWKPSLKSRAVTPPEMGANLFQGRVDLANELILLMKQENEIQSLINQGFTEEAALLAEKYRLEKEIAAIRKQGYPTETLQGEAIREAEKASAARLEAKRNERRDEREKKEAESSDKIKKAEEQATKQAMDAAEKLRLGYINKITEAEIAAMREREKSEKETAASLASWHIENEKKKWQAILDEATKQRKAIDDADKAALGGNQEWLKEQQDIVKKGEQEQKQRDDRAMQTVQGGGLQALNAQRVSDRQAELAREKAAGILARDEVRRKYGGDATKMTKEEIEAVKARILGEKQLDKKKIEAAIAVIPAIEKNIANLVAKLGVK